MPRRTLGHRSLRRMHIAAGACLAALAVAVTCVAIPAQARSPLGDRCRSAWLAIAHHAGGRMLPSRTGGPLVSCSRTGFGGSESRVAVTNDGAVIYEPAVLTPGLLGTGYAEGAPGPRPEMQTSPGGLAVSSGRG